MSRPSSSNIIDDNEGKTAPNVPQFDLSLEHNAEDITLAPGTTTLDVAASATAEGQLYEIYHSMVLVEDMNDPLGLGIEAVSTPVPISWGLVFSAFAGQFGPGGVPEPAPSITVPNAPGLSGQVFYLVLALKDPQGGVIGNTSVLRVEIQ